ncbi:choline transporter-like [Raphidocelis subcapitata]|uniref:Choline transporter-like protein n=1 Tax=Raphidocelis subcapitata TaxID=307507 RepID=A0A2V0PHL0_9CHLO|nr:choline transporter-like [Raphidocelis subcapitata]|eukprot:GBF99304.1 choline transporter-like [Raphidocelis subcapitata]
MACCGGRDSEEDKEGLVEERRCRDVLFLLVFGAYLVGMFVVAGIAFKEGDPRRLVYALDSRGLLCGTNNTYRDGSVDLTDRPNLYYLNALDLLDPVTLPYAKSVCVADCPSDFHRCSIGALPCTLTEQYRCPYYRFAEAGLYGRLANATGAQPADADTAYYAELASAALPAAECNATVLAAAAAKVPGLSAFADPSICSAAAAGAAGAYLRANSQFPGKGPCYPVCFPRFPEELTGAVVSALNATAGAASGAAGALASEASGARALFSNYIADISKGILIVVIGGLAAGVVLSLVWMLVLRYFAGVMAWATIAIVNAGLVACTLYAYHLAGKLSNAGSWGAAVEAQFQGYAGQDPSLVSRQNWAYIAYGLTGLTGAVALFTLVMMRRVAVAVACIKVASQAVAAMPSVLLFPLLPFVLEVGLIVYWVAVAAVLYSAGVPTAHWRDAANSTAATPLQLPALSLGLAPAPAAAGPPDTSNMTTWDVIDACASAPDCYVTYDWNRRLMYAFIVHLFGLLWGGQFIVGLSGVTVAGAVASYYWARGGAEGMPRFPVVRALRRTVAYHLGSIALGSFVIAVVQFVRLLLDYADKKTRRLQAESKIASWAMCIVKTLAWLLEKIVAFINRNAYIMVAVKGKGYCASAARGVQLVVANALRLATVNIVGDALLFLGKLAVAACCGVVAFGMANLPYYNDPEGHPSTYLSSAILPIAVAAVTGFVVAQARARAFSRSLSIFFSVYELAIDTVLLSFCEDAESHGGHPRHAPLLLMEAVGERPPREEPVEGFEGGGGGGGGQRKGRR